MTNYDDQHKEILVTVECPHCLEVYEQKVEVTMWIPDIDIYGVAMGKGKDTAREVKL
jgi:hypothetical protein